MTKVPNVGSGIPCAAPQAQEESGTKITASLPPLDEELDDELDDELDEELEDELDEEVDELEEELDDELEELEPVSPPQPTNSSALLKAKDDIATEQ